jgi:hypothetical protein
MTAGLVVVIRVFLVSIGHHGLLVVS